MTAIEVIVALIVGVVGAAAAILLVTTTGKDAEAQIGSARSRGGPAW